MMHLLWALCRDFVFSSIFLCPERSHSTIPFCVCVRCHSVFSLYIYENPVFIQMLAMLTGFNGNTNIHTRKRLKLLTLTHLHAISIHRDDLITLYLAHSRDEKEKKNARWTMARFVCSWYFNWIAQLVSQQNCLIWFVCTHFRQTEWNAFLLATIRYGFSACLHPISRSVPNSCTLTHSHTLPQCN